MSVPGFTAEDVFDQSRGHYRAATVFASESGALVSAALAKGTHCQFDPESGCASKHTKVFCPSYDPDDCYETGACCTPPPPPPPPQPTPDRGCCPEGFFCCGGVKCCHVGTYCLFGNCVPG
jgi:hypothetical protein